MSFPVGNYELCFCDFFIKEDESGGYLTKWNNVLNHSIKSVNERFCHLVFVDRMLFCQDVMSAAAFVILKCFSVRYFKVWCELTEIIMIQKRQWLDSGFTSASGGVFYDLDYKAISISSEFSLIWMLIDLLIQNHILYFAKSVVSDRSNLLSMWLLEHERLWLIWCERFITECLFFVGFFQIVWLMSETWRLLLLYWQKNLLFSSIKPITTYVRASNLPYSVVSEL